ncbi:MAG: DHH family phosphoesterase [Clostridia bacterium]|nr:DHH family phosphoesterase [Clostridia bacterium]
MKKIKFNDVFVPRYRMHLIIILVILLYMCLITLDIAQITIPAALIIYAYVLYLTYRKNKRLKERIINNMNSFLFKLKTDDTVLNFPIPAVIVGQDGDILWNNFELDLLLKGMNKQKYIENVIHELNEEYDKTFIGIDKEISIHDKHYRLLGNVLNVSKRRGHEKRPVLMLYFIDRTDYYRLFKMYDDSKNCVGIVMVDNYEELVQGMIDTDKPQLVATVEKKIREWFAFTGGIMTSLDRNKYLMVFDKKYLKDFINTKFQILDEIKEISLTNKIPVTLSMAMVVEDGTNAEKFRNAIATLDVALGRGGDQVVIRKEGKYEFFGGNSKEIEKVTKVKPRVISQALGELIEGASNVVIMGHANSDADSLGAAMGVYRLAKTFNKNGYIVLNDYGVALEGLCKKILQDDQYKNVLVGENEILNKMDENTLLVVVDTHIAGYVNSKNVLAQAKKVVIIDHHRRSTDAIDDAVLTFHEVYASSASELVTELLQYSEAKIDITKLEAECLYAGILTDTKNFMQKTGVRTFEAAAYLKKTGIDVAAINKAFQNDVDTYVAIADVIRNSEIICENVAIAICPSGIENQIQITAQAADELLNLNGIEASFVLSVYDNKVYISGRSTGELNVQVVLEKFGGGGHMMIAGAQVENSTVEEVKENLAKVIKDMKR